MADTNSPVLNTMAEPQEQTPQPPQPTVFKRRRLQGACDICKHKKIRCDSANMPNNRCSNCIAFNAECTHVNTRKRSGPYNLSSSSNYDKSSSSHNPRLSTLEDARTIHPLIQPMLSSPSSLDFDTQRSFAALSQHILKLEHEIQTLKQASNTSASSQDASSTTSSTSMEDLPENTLETSTLVNPDALLSGQLKRMTISGSQARHFGFSSTMSLLGDAIQVGKDKNKMTISDDDLNNRSFRRPQFWTVHPWEYVPEEDMPMHDIPDQELLYQLVDLYFEHTNSIFPLLHRPTFEKGLREGLHLTNRHFGATVLGVCAVASRYTDNPAVFLPGSSRYSAGWKWFSQIRQCWRTSARTALLQDIQTICLALIYAHGTSQMEACWMMAGIGIRFAIDVGAHRRGFRDQLTPESESWKRCFWLLVCFDALLSSFLGRPRATTTHDYDLDLPLECDDEYWEPADPTLAFQQPQSKPSKVSSFVSYIKLVEILEYAQRTLYIVNRRKCQGSRGCMSDEEIVAHLDSQLNQWFDGMPEHLKWNSCQPGTPFYEQSALLHACYYHVRILVHRPFIPLPKKPSTLPFPSLAICAHAARSCARILKAHSDNGSLLPFPQIQFSAFTCGILLLVNYWTNLKSTSQPQEVPNEDIRTVHDCISVLAKLETRWTSAGRLRDVIREIVSYAEASTSAQAANQDGDGQGNKSNLFLPEKFQSQRYDSVYQAQSTPSSSWGPDIPSQTRGWEPHTQTAESRAGMNSDNSSWWNDAQAANEFQYNFASSLPFYGNAPRPNIADEQGDPQWSLATPAGETNMGVGDVAMLWLQTPQLSDWMEGGGF